MSPEQSRPVFIIGGSRTGSTMLEVILSKSPDIDMTDELLIFGLPWLQRDLNSNIKKHVGPLDAPGALDKLMLLLYSGIPFGWFWSVPERMLNREMLYRELSAQPLSIKTIFHAILVVHARMRGKPRLGAKFPMHYSYTKKLLEWYPDCLLIHTTRNPKAIYASQAAKYLKPEQNLFSRYFMRIRQFIHINIQITWTARTHKQLRALPNYRLIRYEDMVLESEKEIHELCKFLGIAFQENMLKPQQYGSSFEGTEKGQHGIDPSSLYRWRSAISPVTAKALDFIHRRAYRLFGYRDDETSPPRS